MNKLIINSNGKPYIRRKVVIVSPSLGKTAMYEALKLYFKDKL